jgi:hypothetical protein
VLDCQETTPEQAGFPGARLIGRLKRRVRRKGESSTEIVYLITSLTLDQLQARGWLQLKRGYWVIESKLHHILDVTLEEDRSRLRQPNAALVLGMFRRVAVSFALAWLEGIRAQKPKSRKSARSFQQTFHRHGTGPERLRALIFSKSPRSWRLEK